MLAPAEVLPTPTPIATEGKANLLLKRLAKVADVAVHPREAYKAAKRSLEGDRAFDDVRRDLRQTSELRKFQKGTAKKTDKAIERLDEVGASLAMKNPSIDKNELRGIAFEEMTQEEQTLIAERMKDELQGNAPDYVKKYYENKANGLNVEAIDQFMTQEDVVKDEALKTALEKVGADGLTPDLKAYYDQKETARLAQEEGIKVEKQRVQDIASREGQLSDQEVLFAAGQGVKLSTSDEARVLSMLLEDPTIVSREGMSRYLPVLEGLDVRGAEYKTATERLTDVSGKIDGQKTFVDQTVDRYLETKRLLAEAEANASVPLTSERIGQIMLDHELQVPLDRLHEVQDDFQAEIDAAVTAEVIAKEIAKNNPELEGTAAVKVAEAKKLAIQSELDLGLDRFEATTRDGEEIGMEAMGLSTRLLELTTQTSISEALQAVETSLTSVDTVEAVAMAMTGDMGIAKAMAEYWSKTHSYASDLRDPARRSEVEEKILAPQRENLKAAIAVAVERGGKPFTEAGLQLLKKGIILDGKEVPVVRDRDGKIVKILSEMPSEKQGRWEQNGVDRFGNPQMIMREYVSKDVVYGVESGSVTEADVMLEDFLIRLSAESGEGRNEMARTLLAESSPNMFRSIQAQLQEKMNDGSTTLAEAEKSKADFNRVTGLLSVLEHTQSMVATEAGYHSLQAIKNLVGTGEMGEIKTYRTIEEFTRAVSENPQLTSEQQNALKLLFGESSNSYSVEVAGVRLYTDSGVREVERVYDAVRLLASAKGVEFDEYQAEVLKKYEAERTAQKMELGLENDLVKAKMSLAVLKDTAEKFSQSYEAEEQKLSGLYNDRGRMQSQLSSKEAKVMDIALRSEAQGQEAEKTIPGFTKAYNSLHKEVLGLDASVIGEIQARTKLEMKLGKINVNLSNVKEIEGLKHGIGEADKQVRELTKRLKQKQAEEAESKRKLDEARGNRSKAKKENTKDLKDVVAEQKKILLKDLREVDAKIAQLEDVDPKTGRTPIEDLRENYEVAKNNFERKKAIMEGELKERESEEQFVAQSKVDAAKSEVERMQRALQAQIDVTGEWPEGFLPEIQKPMQGGLKKTVEEKRKSLDEATIAGAKANFEPEEATVKSLIEQYKLNGQVSDEQLKEKLFEAVTNQGASTEAEVNAVIQGVLGVWIKAGLPEEGAEELIKNLLVKAGNSLTSVAPAAVPVVGEEADEKVDIKPVA